MSIHPDSKDSPPAPTALAASPWQYVVRHGRLESFPWQRRSATQILDVCQVEVSGCVLGREELDALADEGRVPGSAACGIVSAAPGRKELEGRPVLVPRALACRNCAACRRGFVFRCLTWGRLGETVPGALASRIEVPVGAVVPLVLTAPATASDTRPLPAAGKSPEGRETAETLWPLALLPGALGHIYTAICLAGVAPGDTVYFIGPTSEANLGRALCTLRSASGYLLTETKAAGSHGLPPGDENQLQAQGKSESEGRTHVIVLAPSEAAVSAAFALVDTMGTHHQWGHIGHSHSMVSPPGGSLGSPLSSISFLRQPDARAWAAAAPLLPALTDELLLRFVPGTHPDLLTELYGWVSSGRLDLAPHIEAVEAVGLDQALVSVAQDATGKNFIYRP